MQGRRDQAVHEHLTARVHPALECVVVLDTIHLHAPCQLVLQAASELVEHGASLAVQRAELTHRQDRTLHVADLERHDDVAAILEPHLDRPLAVVPDTLAIRRL